MKGNTFTGAIMPLVLFKIDGINDRDFKVMAYMFQLETYLSSGNPDGRFFHKEQEIADEMGCNIDKIKRSLKKLEQLGLISKKRQGMHRGNIYWINRDYLKDLENQVGTSYKDTKRVSPKKEEYTMIAEQKPAPKAKTKAIEPIKDKKGITTPIEAKGPENGPKNSPAEPVCYIVNMTHQPQYVEVRNSGNKEDNFYNMIMGRIPENIRNGLSRVDKTELSNAAKSMLTDGRDLSFNSWKEKSGFSPNKNPLWLNQLWNSIK